MVVTDGIPAIVTQELYDRVQERFAKNRKAPARYKAEEHYILTTKLHCGTCGAYMVGESGTSATGKTYHYYKCVNNKNRNTYVMLLIRCYWVFTRSTIDLCVQHYIDISGQLGPK